MDAPTSIPDSSRILIVADDLTGGNACGALFAEAGRRTLTLAGPGTAGGIDLDSLLDDYDVVVVNAESRHLAPEKAAEVTAGILAAAGSVDLVSCRIDTTLRGNVGATAEAIISGRRALLAATPGTRVVGLCVPAFPSAGRFTIGGRQLLHGTRLEDTELRNDVRSPVNSSVIADVLATDSTLSSHHISLDSVIDGADSLRRSLLEGLDAQADVLVVDALTSEHIETIGTVAGNIAREIADRASALGQSQNVDGRDPDFDNLEWVSIDPGPSSLALAQGLLTVGDSPILFGVSGSATEVTRSQLGNLADGEVEVLRTVLDEDGVPDVDATVERVLRVTSAKAVIVATVLDGSDLRELTEAQSALIPRRLAQITCAVLSARAVSGLYTTGGDVTAAVLEALDALGMELDSEIIPLAVGGRVAGGPYSGMPIVTKGGLIGEAGTATQCLEHLALAARLTTVHPTITSRRTP